MGWETAEWRGCLTLIGGVLMIGHTVCSSRTPALGIRVSTRVLFKRAQEDERVKYEPG